MKVWIVSYDHPLSNWGVDTVHRERDDAKKHIKAVVYANGYKLQRDFKKTNYSNKAITVYEGVGNASGIYYYITRRDLR